MDYLKGIQILTDELSTSDYFSNSTNSTNSTSFNSTVPAEPLQCEEVFWNIDGFQISEPSLIPTCLLAAFVGIWGGSHILRTRPSVGSMSYALTFFMFAFMMTDAMIAHCFLPYVSGNSTPSAIGMLISVLDVGLTSSIGLSFGFNALIDLGILKETKATFAVMITSYVGLCALWYYTFIEMYAGNAGMKSFMILYFGVVGVSCAFYMVAQIIILCRNHFRGIGWLLFGGAMGFFGILSVFLPEIQLWFCEVLSPYFNGDFIWFLLSDFAMWGLYRYFITRAAADQVQRSAWMSPVEYRRLNTIE
eukprot:TRINITY_DN6202_c0_g1_i1.p1 TRINITY_DN6202_c0_g1~~TRINITY_DN6202_c0_g1_i1.p1  ORF type:complete len:305 (+),score=48.46 TRINITY_DN6202_c0_g1_i1:141-1055(+)